MKLNEEKLRRNGWHENDIRYTKEILRKAEENKKEKIRRIEQIAIWLVMISIIIATIAGAWVIEPLLLILNKTGAIIAITISGLFFGTFMSISIKEIEVLEKHHHKIIKAIIPISALITSIIISNQAQKIMVIAHLTVKHNPYILGLSYVISTIIPHIIMNQIKRN